MTELMAWETMAMVCGICTHRPSLMQNHWLHVCPAAGRLNMGINADYGGSLPQGLHPMLYMHCLKAEPGNR